MARPKEEFTNEEIAAMRAQLKAWMAAKDHSLKTFAELLDVSVECARFNLAEGGAPYEKRGLARPFLEKARRATGLPLGRKGAAPTAAAAPDTLEPGRAEQLVGVVGRLTLITTEQGARLLQMSPSAFNRLGAELKAAGVLDSCPEPLASGQPGPRYLWTLGPGGYKQATQMLGRAPARPIVKGKLRSDVLVSHTLLVAEVAVAVLLELGDRLLYWETDAGCRCRLTGVPGRSFAEPDLLFVYAQDGVAHACWVEAETGTQGEPEVAQKTRMVDDYHSHWLVHDHGTNRLRLLWVVPKPWQLQRLLEWTGPRRPHTEHWYGAIEDIRTLGITAPIWTTIWGGDNKVGLLGP